MNGLCRCNRAGPTRDARGAYVNSKTVVGRSAICATERAIFEELGLPWRAKDDRDTWYTREELGAANAAMMDDDGGAEAEARADA